MFQFKRVLNLTLALLAMQTLHSMQQKLPPTRATPPASANAAKGVSFSEVTKAAGLAGFRFVAGSQAKDYIIDAAGSGCAFIDYDNDGWQDIYLVNGSTLDALRGKAKAPKAALYRNNRDGTFTDVTEKAGVANERWGQGVCIGDIDNDGWEDIFVTNFGRNRLYRNNRNGTFTDIAEKAGVALGVWSAGCAFGDYDGDGLLDLFVSGYIKFDIDHPPPPATGDAAAQNPENKEQATGGMGAGYMAGAKYCQYRGARVMCGPRGLEGERDFLFRNNGNGTFTEVSEKAGVADKEGYYGFGVAWLDVDDDGKLDLFVANDSTPNYLYRNKGNGTFENISYQSGTALNENGREQACMGVAIGDYDGDGRADIHVTNFADDLNALYHNDDGQNFTETTHQAGLGTITTPFLGWGTNFFDYDHDGWLDLLVANGHIYPNLDEANWGTSYKQRLLLFRNLKGRFDEVGSSAGEALYTPRCSRGSSTGDFDNDGDLDVLLTNVDDGPSLLRNDGANQAGHWLIVKLIGDPSQKCPRDAIGTTVFCTVQGRRLRAEVASGRSFYSQSDLRLHFGLGSANKIDKFEVRWANGKTEQYQVKAVDQFVTIEQGKGVVKGG
ncbi:MAG TPA: CRTAC1 family protein [Blastocatellia bacterium]|nr:CRTAC1 family protein [Blastocatellia bacterium]